MVSQFTKDCPLTLQAMQNIQVDKRNPEVYDTTRFDHPVDALRYAVMAKTLIQGDIYEPESFGERETDSQIF